LQPRRPVRALPPATRFGIAAFRALPGARGRGRAGGEMDRGPGAARQCEPAHRERERAMNAARLVGVVWLLAAAGAMGQETGAPADEAAEEPAPRVDASSYTARGATDEIVLDRTEVT